MLLAMDTRSGEVKRFLIAPDGAEVCGTQMTADGRTLFVNIQHPGEDGSFDAASSNWPATSRDATVAGAAGARPRSATIVITRNDGSEIGI